MPFVMSEIGLQYLRNLPYLTEATHNQAYPKAGIPQMLQPVIFQRQLIRDIGAVSIGNQIHFSIVLTPFREGKE